jgi:hypothetical protein
VGGRKIGVSEKKTEKMMIKKNSQKKEYAKNFISTKHIQKCADVVDTIIKLFTNLPTLNERNFTEILVYLRLQSAMTADFFSK